MSLLNKISCPSQQTIKIVGTASTLVLVYSLSFLLPNIAGLYAARKTVKDSCKNNNDPCELFKMRTGVPIQQRLLDVVIPWIIGLSAIFALASYASIRTAKFLYIKAKKGCCPNMESSLFNSRSTNRFMKGFKKIVPDKDTLFYLFVTFSIMTIYSITITAYSAEVLGVEICNTLGSEEKLCQGFRGHNITASRLHALFEISKTSTNTMLGTGITLDFIINGCITFMIIAAVSYIKYRQETDEENLRLTASRAGQLQGTGYGGF